MKKFFVNSDYFKIIDTEKKAYFLGLMYADGYNGKVCGIKNKNINVGRLDVYGIFRMINFCDWIYSNATIYMRRKYRKYLGWKKIEINKRRVVP